MNIERMKNKLTSGLLVILIHVIMTVANAQEIHLHFEFQLNYSGSRISDTTLRFGVGVMGNRLGFSDSFVVNGITKKTLDLRIPVSEFPVQIRVTTGVQSLVPDTWTAGDVLLPADCFNGEILELFNSISCIDIRGSDGGILCGNLKYSAVPVAASEKIVFSGGFPTDPLKIFCRNTPTQYVLRLAGHCALHAGNGTSEIRWYDSIEGRPGWRPAGVGDSLVPAISSDPGGYFFNQKVWYKIAADTVCSLGIYKGYESEIFGPVTFYLGAHPDWVGIGRGPGCHDKRDLVYRNSPAKYGEVQADVFYKADESGPEVYLNAGLIRDSISGFNGRFLQNVNDTFDLRPGIYRVVSRYYSHLGNQCQVSESEIRVHDSDCADFRIHAAVEQTVSCFGGQNGRISARASGSDSNVRFWLNSSPIPGNVQWNCDELRAGIYHLRFANSYSCEVSQDLKVSEPEPIVSEDLKDTILCTDQSFHPVLTDTGITKFLWLYEGAAVSDSNAVDASGAGAYVLHCESQSGCVHRDTFFVRRRNFSAVHDFYAPSAAFSGDTVFAVNVSRPAPDHFFWFGDERLKQVKGAGFEGGFAIPDTGIYFIGLQSHYEGCTYRLSKTIVAGTADSGLSEDPRFGVNGPLILDFSVDPNPGNGANHSLKIRLRDTADIWILRTDPVSGQVTGDLSAGGKKEYELAAFRDPASEPGVYYLKLMAGQESRTLKMLIVK